MNSRARLALLLLITLMLSVFWAFLVPTDPSGFQPDEASHFAVIRFMAENSGALPPYTMEYNIALHPPLYHEIAALLYSILSPVFGAESARVGVRLVSAFLSTGTVYAVYLMARQTRLCRPVAIPVATLAALIPMRLSLSGAASNENLAALGAAASLYVLFSGIRRGFSNRRIALLSFWTVIAIGSKITCLGLLLAIGVAALVVRKPSPSWRGTGAVVLIPVLAVLLSLGWWFIDNTVRYGDPVRKNAVHELFGDLMPGYAGISARTGMPAWRYLLSIVGAGWFSFWGQFAGMRFRLPAGIYVALFAAQLVSLWGIATRLHRFPGLSRTQIAIGAATTAFAAWVLMIYIQYNWQYYTPQGRYFFVLLGPIAIFLVGGIHLFLQRYVPDRGYQQAVWMLGGLLLLLLNLYTLFLMPRLWVA